MGGVPGLGSALIQVENNHPLRHKPQIGPAEITVLEIEETGDDDEGHGGSELEDEERPAKAVFPAVENPALEQIRGAEPRKKRRIG